MARGPALHTPPPRPAPAPLHPPLYPQYWSQQIKSPTNTHSSFYYLGIYGGILGGCAVIVYLRAITFVVASLRLARRIHDAAFWAVLRSPMAYFDTTIKGRITNRFSTDQQKVAPPPPLENPDLFSFWLRTAPRDHQPPTAADRQPLFNTVSVVLCLAHVLTTKPRASP